MIAIFLFYSETLGKKRYFTFSKDIKHSAVILFDGENYVRFQFTKNGCEHRIVNAKNVRELIRVYQALIPTLSAVICTFVLNQKLQVSPLTQLVSCNEFSRLIANIDVGITLNPIHLFKKLLKYDNRTNYEILYKWRRSDGYPEK